MLRPSNLAVLVLGTVKFIYRCGGYMPQTQVSLMIDETMSDSPIAEAKMILDNNAARLYRFKSDS
jgi:hypothetical protein